MNRKEERFHLNCCWVGTLLMAISAISMYGLLVGIAATFSYWLVGEMYIDYHRHKQDDE